MFGSVRRSTIVTLVAYVLLAIASSTASATHTVAADGGAARTTVASVCNIDWC